MMLVWKAIVNGLLGLALMTTTSELKPPWQLVKEPADMAAMEIDRSQAHSGAASAKLSVSKSTVHEIALVDPFRGDAWRGKRVLLTGWVKTNLAGGEAGLAIITNNGGRYSVFYPSDQHLSKQSGWQKLSVLCEVPKDTALMSIGLWVRHGNGAVWVDDLAFATASTGGKAAESRKSPLLTREEMNKIADTYKSASGVPANLDFEMP